MKLSTVLLFTGRIMKLNLRETEKEIVIKAPWGKLAALTWGAPNDPPVFLCHGRMDVCSGFRPLVSLLPASFFYVSVDLPGNGKSDHLPPAGRYAPMDLVPTILSVKAHFQWERFIYVGHSLGNLIGKYFDLSYPGVITRMVELDPVPAHEVWPTDQFGLWYRRFYGDYYGNKYKVYAASPDTAPKYTYEKAVDLIMSSRGLSMETSKHILERCLQPAGDGLYRFTYDQRYKEIPRLPLSAEYMKELYTRTETPTFAVLAQGSIDFGFYHYTPFVQNPDEWPNHNYSVKIVAGGHDVHISSPECMADDVANFLLKDTKAKL